ncbi:PH domain-containing protein [Glaciecola petra]|uniref:PH domain-containing protein n=1 Tax=Glaciecola petra TaxID=3075602 RepID=A0ABU2ZPV4_9ALTE|nr:PH domain-containing protein [Aestuariibacter sp. P117]MDT0594660.1 PH domain-containing protein [Aestuariibacter sp. P117]
MQETPLKSAEFDPKVKQYWLVVWLLLSIVTLFLIPFIPITIIIILLVSQSILDAMSAELFDRKLVVKKGILFKVEKSIPLEKITDVGLTQGPVMRMFGLYRLDFETAGQSGAGALVSKLGIVDAIEFRESILAQKDSLTITAPASTDEKPTDTLVEILDTLKDIKHLLENKPS